MTETYRRPRFFIEHKSRHSFSRRPERKAARDGEATEVIICTPLEARWCPIHGDGDCKCLAPDGSDWLPNLDSPDCPLHNLQGDHPTKQPWPVTDTWPALTDTGPT